VISKRQRRSLAQRSRSAGRRTRRRELLGELVEREVEKYRSQKLRDGELAPRELAQALERARAQQKDLEVLIARLEALARRA